MNEWEPLKFEFSNYNTDFFYQSREYIFESWKEGTPLQ